MIILALFVLLALSGMFAGLTLGIFSQNAQTLRRKAELGDHRAAKLLPLREKGTQLLITLVLSNIAVNAGISVLLDSLTPSFVAVILATIFITIFGEILPQATMSRYGLKYASPFAGLIGLIMKLTGPVIRPAAKFIDHWIGHELPTHMSKEELVKMVEEHTQHEQSKITPSEQRIVEHALTLSETKITDAMTPRKMVIGVNADQTLSPRLLDELHASGHSRFPVYTTDLDQVIGMLYMRNMTQISTKERVREAMEHEVYFVNEERSLEHVLQAFLRTKHHLYMVVNEFREVVGVITIEDVIEHILGREIVDEFDKYDDLRAVAKQTNKKMTSR